MNSRQLKVRTVLLGTEIVNMPILSSLRRRRRRKRRKEKKRNKKRSLRRGEDKGNRKRIKREEEFNEHNGDMGIEQCDNTQWDRGNREI